MRISIMRHGEAENLAINDAQRALTEKGKVNSIQVAKQCVESNIAHYDLILVSPYVRAQQTWQAVSSTFKTTKMETCDDITPYGQADQVFDYVMALIAEHQLESILLISHLPLVSHLTAAFTKNNNVPIFSPSSLAHIELDPENEQGKIMKHYSA